MPKRPVNGVDLHRRDEAVPSPAANEQRLVAQEHELHLLGRAVFGYVGEPQYEGLRSAMRSTGSSAWASLGLGATAGTIAAQVLSWRALQPMWSTAFGVSSVGGLIAVLLVVALTAGLVAIPTAGRWGRRAVLVGSGLLTCAAAVVQALADSYSTLVVGVVLLGAGAGGASATHVSWLADTYRPELRVRMAGVYVATASLVTAGALGLGALALWHRAISWRPVFWAVALVGAVAVLDAARLSVPEQGRWDSARLRRMVLTQLGCDGEAAPDRAEFETAMPLDEQMRRIGTSAGSRSALLLVSVAGSVLLPLPTFVTLALRDRFDVHLEQSAGLVAAGLALAPVLLVWFARRGEIAYRISPELLADLAFWTALASAVAVAAAGVAPLLVLSLLAFVLAIGWLLFLLPAAFVLLASTTHERWRDTGGVVLLVVAIASGGLQWVVFDTVGTRSGAVWGLLMVALVMVVAARGVARRSPRVLADEEDVVRQVIESAELAAAHVRGTPLPLLHCKGIDFSYGPLQVLFGVDFTVDEGEMVALLGTNGAGKSTLLRAISGLGYVDRGSIRHRGTDITHLSSDKRVALGITQVPGGKAVFGPLSVVDNLRASAYALGRNPRAVETAIDAAFDAFPRLAERRNQPASTLSGGEQQMIALSKALILEPRLLLIDELSLGLAPLVVGELLEMVRRINAGGTAVVLVEQSVNIALSLVEHAYFMEKGQIRFDGPAQQLLRRPDLLRAVFLEGADSGAPEHEAAVSP